MRASSLTAVSGQWIENLGGGLLERMEQFRGVSSLLRESLWKAIRMGGTGRRTLWRVFTRQFYFTGVQAFGIVGVVSLVIGIVLVVEVMSLARDAAAQGLLGNLMVWIVFRELAPLLTMLLVIARSGTAISSEMATMKLGGEIQELEFMGIDPVHYLVVPRLLAASLSMVCLNFSFSLIAILGGITMAWALMDASWGNLVGDVLGTMKLSGIFFSFLKSFLSGLLVAAICCYRGLQVQQSPTEIPRETARAVVESLTAAFAVSGLVSAVFYLFFA
ncbi:MAG: ABC transporter permease [Nitrospirae bacterium]|nr:ABC transporter permease [Nitrospirota bacterium]